MSSLFFTNKFRYMPEKISDEDEIIVCLYDGKYHYGVAALANSLVMSNFKGILNIAYSDFLPFWINQLQARDRCSYYLTNDIIIYFERVEPNMHLAYYKPYFIKHTITNFRRLLNFSILMLILLLLLPGNFFLVGWVTRFVFAWIIPSNLFTLIIPGERIGKNYRTLTILFLIPLPTT